jgi:hypothetical protein
MICESKEYYPPLPTTQIHPPLPQSDSANHHHQPTPIARTPLGTVCNTPTTQPPLRRDAHTHLHTHTPLQIHIIHTQQPQQPQQQQPPPPSKQPAVRRDAEAVPQNLLLLHPVRPALQRHRLACPCVFFLSFLRHLFIFIYICVCVCILCECIHIHIYIYNSVHESLHRSFFVSLSLSLFAFFPFFFSPFSLSLSVTHTHTHTHTYNSVCSGARHR